MLTPRLKPSRDNLITPGILKIFFQLLTVLSKIEFQLLQSMSIKNVRRNRQLDVKQTEERDSCSYLGCKCHSSVSKLWKRFMQRPADYRFLRYLLLTSILLNIFVSTWSNSSSNAFLSNKGIPVPKRTGILVIVISSIKSSLRNP